MTWAGAASGALLLSQSPLPPSPWSHVFDYTCDQGEGGSGALAMVVEIFGNRKDLYCCCDYLQQNLHFYRFVWTQGAENLVCTSLRSVRQERGAVGGQKTTCKCQVINSIMGGAEVGLAKKACLEN